MVLARVFHEVTVDYSCLEVILLELLVHILCDIRNSTSKFIITSLKTLISYITLCPILFWGDLLDNSI